MNDIRHTIPLSSPSHSNALSPIDTSSLISINEERENNNQNRRRDNNNRPRVRFASNTNTNNRRGQNISKILDQPAVIVRNRFHQFLSTYDDESNIDDMKYYEREVNRMVEEGESTTIVVNWQHLRSQMGVESDFNDLADMLQEDYYRFEPYLNEAVRDFVRRISPHYIKHDQRNSETEKEFYCSFSDFDYYSKLRELKTSRIGTLCCFSGTITRTTQVRPELTYGSFQCLECGNVMNDIRQQFKYSEPKICGKFPQCTNRKLWLLDIETSKFVDWQKVRVQENSHDLPSGSMPRCMDVILRNDLCETCKPGENIMFTGTLIVVPNVAQYYSHTPKLVHGRGKGRGGGEHGGVSGLKALGTRELSYKLAFLANYITSASTKFGRSDIRDEDEDDPDFKISLEYQSAVRMSETPKLYERMAKCIAPSIYGHDEVKRGILLMLMGGVRKVAKDGCKLRGDINICIVGDPSTAKSQFLMYVKRILPSRTVYTSGKSSTSAGLTAAVIRDKETGEFGIEAGALMLADNGICCIDEFDKMDRLDQSAIHEAMEQQTITITKAGINATLNARASVLAASNPVYGRYDSSKPLRSNISMSAPLMSRFDLFFVVVDDCDAATDRRIGTHIVDLHKNHGNEQILQTDFTDMDMQAYIKQARKLKPMITPESKKCLIRFYRELRQKDAVEQKAYRFTVRQLESLIRLSEALARVHLNEYVLPKYVKEAARLLGSSILSVDAQDIQLFDEDSDDGNDDDNNNGSNNENKNDDSDNDDNDDSGNNNRRQQQISITFQGYQRKAGIVVSLIRRHETSVDDGLQQSVIENLYMKQMGDVLADSADIEHELKVVRYIIVRLINVDNVLLVKPSMDDVEVGERVLIVHPNYDRDRVMTFKKRDVVDGGRRSPVKERGGGDGENDGGDDIGRGGGSGGGRGAGRGRGSPRKIVRGKRRLKK